MPTRGTIDSAGLDIYCPFNITVHADSQKRIPLGIAVEIPKGYVGVLVPRSSICKTPLRVPNSQGYIDADYRGELSIEFENISCKDYEISRGDRIAQLIITPYLNVDVEEAQTLSETERGDDEFCIGELHKGAVLKLKQVEWYKWNEDKGEWIQYD